MAAAVSSRPGICSTESTLHSTFTRKLRLHGDDYRSHTLSKSHVEDYMSRSSKQKQRALLLNAPREQYTLQTEHDIPILTHRDEILIKVLAIGLNPIDWKSAAYNFGIPALPWINGRDLAGIVIQTSEGNSRLRVGDVVLVPSTDYRDIRKAAFQEYAVTTHFNAAIIPTKTSIHAAASVGVAYVAAAFALGISFGLDFSKTQSGNCRGPNLVQVIKDVDRKDPHAIPADVRDECLSCANTSSRIKHGDWVAIWGASTTSGYIALQLAKLCGLKVICVADVARHGPKLIQAGADLLVDRFDTNRAIQIIRGVTKGKLRFAIDTVDKGTATILQNALSTSDDINPPPSSSSSSVVSYPATPTSSSSAESEPQPHTLPLKDQQSSHLLCLSGTPKERIPGITYHTVPIKVFHSTAAVGESLMAWLEQLMINDALVLPEVVHAAGGLEGINSALQTLREGSELVSGKRMVVDLLESDGNAVTV
ncbi:hypothetical protein FQN52_008567 [Onygenales sp. PD_12]|nr:hypothetical protein FQN52_008567 [Onygenales sp. PD_12]